MALRFRIIAAPASRPQDGVDGQGQPLPPIVAYAQGTVFLDVEVYDDALPAGSQRIKMLYREYPSATTSNDILQELNGAVWKMASAKTRGDWLRANAINGTWPVMDPSDPNAPGKGTRAVAG
jgi:hypothetical protein